MSEHQSTSQTENANSSVTVTVSSADEPDAQDRTTFRITLRKPKSTKRVNWTEGTVDNENMDKKKSKCCCIYQKPRAQDESSSDDESDNECEHCYGHVEKKSVLKKHNSAPPPPPNPAVTNSISGT